jgi:hypothetical protein
MNTNQGGILPCIKWGRRGLAQSLRLAGNKVANLGWARVNMGSRKNKQDWIIGRLQPTLYIKRHIGMRTWREKKER